MTRFLTIASLFTVVLFAACGENDEPANDDKVETKDISHDGSIETLLATEHLDSLRDVLITTHKIWKNGVVAAETRHVDTLPALGVTAQQAADANGNATTAVGRKDYEFYITVK